MFLKSRLGLGERSMSQRSIEIDKILKYVKVRKRRYPAEIVDENHIHVFIPLRTVMRMKFLDLPFKTVNGEPVIMEVMPLAVLEEESYTYKVEGLEFYDNLTLWREEDKGHVYLEKTIIGHEYAYRAWMPLGLYSLIASKLAEKYGYTVEVLPEEKILIIEAEKTFPLESRVREAVREALHIDKETKKIISKLENMLSRRALRKVSEKLRVEIGEIENILSKPEQASTTP